MSAPIGIAGAGRIAQALGRLLGERGEPVAAIASRYPEHAAAAAAFVGGAVEPVPYSGLPERAERILVAVPDDAVPAVAALLADAGMRGGMAVHTCGARGPEALAALAACGVSCAALHPLETVATPEQGLAALPGAAYGITGDGPAADWGTHIVSLVGGRLLRIPPERRALYHAAAVMASNYITGLIDAAVLLMAAAGVERDGALAALAPLARTSTENALRLGPLAALTGPLERGDAATLSAHLAALDAAPASVRELYRAAALHLLELARRRPAPPLSLPEIETLLRKGPHA